VNPRSVILSTVFLSVAAVGCTRPTAEFSLNEKTDELIPEAQAIVEQQLQEDFGTPEDLIAWQKFPIDFGKEETIKVTVKSFNTSSKGVIDVELPADEELELTEAVLRVSGKEDHEISRYDAESGRLYVKPAIETEVAVDDEVTIVTRQAGWKLKNGRNLYMKHCVHCHGVSGDGAGPTAQYLNPRPRDYRLGIFKFTSTISTEKAAKGDLAQILHEGVPGTSMPSFKLKLIGDDMDAVVSYVLFLATRGEYEIRLGSELKALGGSKDDIESQLQSDSGQSRQALIKEFMEQDEVGEGLDEFTDEIATMLAEDWERAQLPESVVIPKKPRPEPTAESIARGRALFISKDAKCSDCHGVQGYGDGKQTEEYQQMPNSTLTYDKPGMYDEWGNPIKPRNLHKGIYRGGRRPIDVYRRIYAGIKGALMPGFGTSLSDDQIWDLVNYVMSLPYEETSPSGMPEQKEVASHTVK